MPVIAGEYGNDHSNWTRPWLVLCRRYDSSLNAQQAAKNLNQIIQREGLSEDLQVRQLKRPAGTADVTHYVAVFGEVPSLEISQELKKATLWGHFVDPQEFGQLDFFPVDESRS